MGFKKFLIEVTIPDKSISEKLTKALVDNKSVFWEAGIDNLSHLTMMLRYIADQENLSDEFDFDTIDGSHSTLKDYLKFGIAGGNTDPQSHIITLQFDSDKILDVINGKTGVSFEEFVSAIKKIVNHELVHVGQLNKIKPHAYDKVVSKAIGAATINDYMKYHLEIEGHAHQAFEELKDHYIPEMILKYIRNGDTGKLDVSNVYRNYRERFEGTKTFDKFIKIIVKYITRESEDREAGK